MSRKYIYLFTFLLFYLFSPSSVQAAGEDFPVMGGTTSDGIKISDVKLVNLKKVDNLNSIQLVGADERATMSFTVDAPRKAQLSYKLVFKMDGDEETLQYSSIYFKALLNGKSIKPVSINSSLFSQSRKFDVPAGKSKVEFEITFNVREDCAVAGFINTLFLHIHQYDDANLKRQAICGKEGKVECKCTVCGKKQEIIITPKFDKHVLDTTTSRKSSCLDNQGNVERCVNCPYTNIKHSELVDHQLDADGRCTVCGLHKPRSNADGTVYEIRDAGEMRILSELLSMGRIPGNVGVDIKADLVFDKVPMLPLGNFTHPFSGVLNGNGHRISGITSCYQGGDGLGIVGVAQGTILTHAVIANLIFDGGNTMQGAACVGGIVGQANYCDILNCASFGTLEGTNRVGGIVGFAGQHVSIINCASVNTIRTEGRWNPMACGMTAGKILNSYGAVANEPEGRLDSLRTATLRHCFATHGDGDRITRITRTMLSSYEMEQWLSEESESIPFMMSEQDSYPVPVVDTTVVTRANGPVAKVSNAVARRADSSDDGGDSDKTEETEQLGGYVDANSEDLGQTVEEIVAENAMLYPDLNRLFVVTRTVPEGSKLYELVSGGELEAFESYLIPADSAYLKMREYDIVAPEQVMAVTETVDDLSGPYETIDEYKIEDGVYSLESRIMMETIFNLVYQKNIDGVLKTIWTIETSYDDLGHPAVTKGFSHNPTTGEIRLEYSYTYTRKDKEALIEDGSYEEYVDYETNTIHVIYNYTDSITGAIVYRDHYILCASDLFVQEIRTEKMVNGQPKLVDGAYFLYNDDGSMKQTVCFAPVDANNLDSEVRPYVYDEYIGSLMVNPFPTAILVPSLNHPSLQKRMDSNIYDMQGRVVRKVTDTKDPFSGLPVGIYLYQGTKYLKR